MKSTILLTTALFLASAPAPDSETLAEVSAGFLSQSEQNGLMAAPKMPGDSMTTVDVTAQSTVTLDENPETESLQYSNR
jgi:hypothetical protein